VYEQDGGDNNGQEKGKTGRDYSHLRHEPDHEQAPGTGSDAAT